LSIHECFYQEPLVSASGLNGVVMQIMAFLICQSLTKCNEDHEAALSLQHESPKLILSSGNSLFSCDTWLRFSNAKPAAKSSFKFRTSL
jgi:hypothetical protein